MDSFYVYAYCDPRKASTFISGFEPFYIGKGTGNRMFHHLQSRKNKNSIFVNKLKKLKFLGLSPIIIKVQDVLTEEAAFNKEKELIKQFGMYPNGCLCNLSEGGSGGRVSDLSIEKIRNSLKGKSLKDETKEKISEALKNRPRNESTKEKISKTLKGKVHSAERRAKISEGRKQQISDVHSLKKYLIEIDGRPFATLFGVRAIDLLGFSGAGNSLNTGKPISRGEFKGWQIIKG